MSNQSRANSKTTPYETMLDQPLYQGLNRISQSTLQELEASTGDGRRTCRECGKRYWPGEFSLSGRDSQGAVPDTKKQRSCNYCLRTPRGYWLKSTYDEAWRERAACKGMDQEAFFESTVKKGRPPKGYVRPEPPYQAACDSCPVKKECLDYAHESRSVGVWGGQFLDTEYHNRRNGTARPFGVVPKSEDRALVLKELRYMYEQGMSVRLIAEKTDTKYATVYAYLKEAGTVMRKAGGNYGR